MNSSTPDWQPNPMRPGGPMIPTRWDVSPYNRWTFQRVREWTPTATIWRGPGPILPLPQRLTDVDGIEFEANGRRSTIGEFLDRSYTDGFLVLHRGEIVAEKYMNGLQPHTPHLAMSVSKSFTGTLVGILVHKGLINPNNLVTQYLPELEATAYRGAKVQHVLDMTAGVKIQGPYNEPSTHAHMFQLATGWWPLEAAQYPHCPKNTWEAILRLTEQEAPHGAQFDYRSPENNVLGFIMQRVTGKTIPELFSSELWAPMGAEEDAYITVDRGGFACTDGGLNATLRDYARFALLHLRGGKINGRQIIPGEWIQETRTASNHLFQIYQGSTDYLPKGAYHNTFWIEDPERRAIWCLGHGGQHLYIDPEGDFAAVKVSYWPDAWKLKEMTPGRESAREIDLQASAISMEAIVAIHAIRDALVGPVDKR
ncbi:MAG: serine hydrolase [Mesorhizobium sp.]|uniref:serine hydrolase domain-containing protein n=1 Tax=Mesorhizobium sp. TaxID=1871066 RepID=UPI0012046716|nr:serine hydrolase [Mesorhizobium sp.]TIR16632.1 MAG: serine hydrolase [Mesorhizobium sp.]